jgi:hypothetical protein
MGQYFIAILLGETSADGKETIRAWTHPYAYNDGSKLIEHSYVGGEFMTAIEYLISPKGEFYKTRVVWAGDYADNEPYGKNLYHSVIDDLTLNVTPLKKVCNYQYIVNHTKQEYIQKPKRGRIHPLSILTAEGNGAGAGDYRGSNESKAGLWARDVLSMEDKAPQGFCELHIKFREECESDSDSGIDIDE